MMITIMININNDCRRKAKVKTMKVSAQRKVRTIWTKKRRRKAKVVAVFAFYNQI